MRIIWLLGEVPDLPPLLPRLHQETQVSVDGDEEVLFDIATSANPAPASKAAPVGGLRDLLQGVLRLPQPAFLMSSTRQMLDEVSKDEELF